MYIRGTRGDDLITEARLLFSMSPHLHVSVCTALQEYVDIHGVTIYCIFI